MQMARKMLAHPGFGKAPRHILTRRAAREASRPEQRHLIRRGVAQRVQRRIMRERNQLLARRLRPLRNIFHPSQQMRAMAQDGRPAAIGRVMKLRRVGEIGRPCLLYTSRCV